MIVAAGVAFYFFLSVFPTLFAAVSIYGLVAEPARVQDQAEALAGVLPPAALELLRSQLQSLVSTGRATLGWGTVLSLLLAVWSATKGSGALIDALNIVYDVREKRGFLKLRAVALAISLGFVLFLLSSLSLIAAVPPLLAAVELSPAGQLVSRVMQWGLLFALVLLVLALVYRHAPSHEAPRSRWVSPGAFLAALLWLAASASFSWYAANFGRFNETHGALGGVVALLLWLQISCLVVLLGAELDAAVGSLATGRSGTASRA